MKNKIIILSISLFSIFFLLFMCLTVKETWIKYNLSAFLIPLMILNIPLISFSVIKNCIQLKKDNKIS